MKRSKLMILFIALIFITGCTSKELVKNYDNMNIDKHNINGYSLDLRIYGNYNEKIVNEIVRITNYNNKEYEIKKANTDIGKDNIKENLRDDMETIYIIDGKTYVKNEDGKYIEGKNDTYNNPSIYLEGLKNIASHEKPITEKIGNNSYKKYQVVFKKEIVNNILNDTVLKGMQEKKDVDGEIYLDKDGYVYRIIYYLETVTINANYYAVNLSRQINFPSDISINK